jgi:hypothetical protein
MAHGPPATSTDSDSWDPRPCSPTASGSTEELELIAERGATVVANPAANMKLAVGGLLPYPEAERAGVAIGTRHDGVSSNPTSTCSRR